MCFKFMLTPFLDDNGKDALWCYLHCASMRRCIINKMKDINQIFATEQ